MDTANAPYREPDRVTLQIHSARATRWPASTRIATLRSAGFPESEFPNFRCIGSGGCNLAVRLLLDDRSQFLCNNQILAPPECLFGFDEVVNGDNKDAATE